MYFSCKKLIFACMLCVSANFATAQKQGVVADTVSITLDSAESIFLRNNLQLLAQRYNVDAQKALVIQAKLFPNPNLDLGRGPVIPIYDPTSPYPHSNFFSNTENTVSVSQLILLAGKINKQVKLAEANVKLSEQQFQNLITTLKYALRSNFFNIYYMQQSAKVYDKEIISLQQVVKAFNAQEGKGYIAEKEVVRIKAQLYSLQSEYLALVNQINDTESALRLLLQIKDIYILPQIDEMQMGSLSPSKYSYSILIDTAYKNRTDLQMARTNTEISKLNYTYQKALAMPDITPSISWDKQGSYALNLVSVGVSFDLPFFSRNQGNIKSAKAAIDVNNAMQKTVEAQVEEQIYRALQKAYDNDKMYHSIDSKFSNDFDRLLNEVLENYKKRNIGLLDFLDFYDSYKQNTLELNSVKYNRVQSFEDINYFTESNLFN